MLAHVRLGNVLGREVLHVGVRLLCLLAIAVETNEAELGTTDQSWRNVGYANLLAVEIGAEVKAELIHKGLGGAVDVAATVRVRASDRSNVDNVALHVHVSLL